MRVHDEVTVKLVEELELDLSRQRLDSSHVFSTMATFGRTRLMGVTIKRFLTQVKRHDAAAYCPVRQNKKSSRLDHTAHERRIAQRRRAQDTDAARRTGSANATRNARASNPPTAGSNDERGSDTYGSEGRRASFMPSISRWPGGIFSERRPRRE